MNSPVLFQFLPPLAPEEYAALEASIRQHGVQVPIIVDERGVVIDGHHRRRIAESLGVHCPQTRLFDKTDAEKRTLALTLNLDRRNLNREQRRAIVEASVKADPQMSDRAHAQRTGVDHKTVGRVRAQVGNFPTSPAAEHVDPATGEVMSEEDFVEATVDLSTDEFETAIAAARDQGDMSRENVVAHIQTSAAVGGGEAPAAAEQPKVIGLDGKTYTRPAPTPQRDPIRRPLREGFRDASLDLGKLVDRIARLVTDDRYPRNRDEVAPYRNDLIRARDALDRLIEQMSN